MSQHSNLYIILNINIIACHCNNILCKNKVYKRLFKCRYLGAKTKSGFVTKTKYVKNEWREELQEPYAIFKSTRKFGRQFYNIKLNNTPPFTCQYRIQLFTKNNYTYLFLSICKSTYYICITKLYFVIGEKVGLINISLTSGDISDILIILFNGLKTKRKMWFLLLVFDYLNNLVEEKEFSQLMSLGFWILTVLILLFIGHLKYCYLLRCVSHLKGKITNHVT